MPTEENASPTPEIVAPGTIHSAAPKVPVAAAAILRPWSVPRPLKDRIITAAELCAQAPNTPPYIVEPYLVAGATTELVGKVKIGKSDLTLAMCLAIVTGDTFLGRPTERTQVVYLTEQPAASFRASLARARLASATGLHILSWADSWGRPWDKIVEDAAEAAHELGARVLIVDTLSKFAGIRGDGENSAGEADAAMAPLLRAAASGLAVWVVRHERKSAGEVGDSGRGSSAFSGAVDIALVLRRAVGSQRTVRILSGVSRFDDLPDEEAIDRTDDGYVSLGEEVAFLLERTRRELLDAVPVSEPQAKTFDELHAMVGGGRTTTQNAMRQLVASGELVEIGKGVKGNPHKYHRRS